MTSLSLASTTASTPAVVRHAASIKDALRRAFSLTRVPQSKYIDRLKKSVLSSVRCKAVEIVCALVVDLARRGSVEDAEAIGLHLSAIARAEHAAAHPEASQVQLSRAEAQIAEEHAEGLVEECETRLSLYPTLSNRLAYLAASAEHTRARQQLDAAVRREVAAE